MCVLNVQDTEDRTLPLQLLKQNNFFVIEFQFCVTERHDLKLFAFHVQYIQWGMLE